MAGNINQQHRLAFRDLLTVCQLRGRDSTGVVNVKSTGKATYAKRVGTPELLIDSKTYDREIETGWSKALIGHCRAKTFGDGNTENAHPFQHGTLTGVHNGTLKFHHGKERAKDFGTDSEWLYWHASEHGMDETIRALDPLGAWALVWWDENGKSLNFLRNKERPLWFTHTKDMKVMVWASEIWMLGAFSRKYELWDGGDDKRMYYQLPVDTLYSFNINENKNTPQEIFQLQPPVEMKGEVRGYSGNVHGWTGSANNYGGEVVRPFDKTLDDNIDDVARRIRVRKAQEDSLNQGGATTTASTGNNCSRSLPIVSDFRMDTKALPSSQSNIHLLPNPTTRTSQQRDNAGNSRNSKQFTPISTGNLRQSRDKLTTVRELGGMQFVTDMKTHREFGVEKIQEQTEGMCCFCDKPIGDLTEINEIFLLKDKDHNDVIDFICTSCVIPAVA